MCRLYFDIVHDGANTFLHATSLLHIYRENYLLQLVTCIR